MKKMLYMILGIALPACVMAKEMYDATFMHTLNFELFNDSKEPLTIVLLTKVVGGSIAIVDFKSKTVKDVNPRQFPLVLGPGQAMATQVDKKFRTEITIGDPQKIADQEKYYINLGTPETLYVKYTGSAKKGERIKAQSPSLFSKKTKSGLSLENNLDDGAIHFAK